MLYKRILDRPLELSKSPFPHIINLVIMSLINLTTSTLGCHLLAPTPQMALLMKVPFRRGLSYYNKPPIKSTQRLYHHDPRPFRYESLANEQRSHRPAAYTPSEIRHSQPAFSHLRSRVEPPETRHLSEPTNIHESRILDELYKQSAAAEQQHGKVIEELRILNQTLYNWARRSTGPGKFEPVHHKADRQTLDADQEKPHEDRSPDDDTPVWPGVLVISFMIM